MSKKHLYDLAKLIKSKNKHEHCNVALSKMNKGDLLEYINLCNYNNHLVLKKSATGCRSLAKNTHPRCEDQPRCKWNTKKGCVYKYWNQIYLLSETKVWKLKYRDNFVIAYHAYRGKPLKKVNEIEFNNTEDTHQYIKYQVKEKIKNGYKLTRI